MFTTAMLTVDFALITAEGVFAQAHPKAKPSIPFHDTCENTTGHHHHSNIVDLYQQFIDDEEWSGHSMQNEVKNSICTDK